MLPSASALPSTGPCLQHGRGWGRLVCNRTENFTERSPRVLYCTCIKVIYLSMTGVWIGKEKEEFGEFNATRRLVQFTSTGNGYGMQYMTNQKGP